MSPAVDGVLNQSLIPLRIASFVSLIVGTITLVGTFGFLVGKLFFGQDWPAGYATSTILLLFSIALNAMFSGIIGEYLGRVFLQSKGRPPVVESVVNDPINRSSVSPTVKHVHTS
jgi:dolichol-phosphate mannosyltransferase